MCRTETPRRGKSGTESGAKQAQPVLAVWNLKFGLVRVLGANQTAANVIAAIFNDLDRLKCRRALQRKIQRHLPVRQHDVSFRYHSQQPLFIATRHYREVGEVEFAHALDDFVHGLIGKGILHVS